MANISDIQPIKPNRIDTPARYDRGSLFREARHLRDIFQELASSGDEDHIAKRIKHTYIEEVHPHVKKIYNRDPFLSVAHYLIFKDKSPRRVTSSNRGRALILKHKVNSESGYHTDRFPFHLQNVLRRARLGKIQLT